MIVPSFGTGILSEWEWKQTNAALSSFRAIGTFIYR